MEKFEILSKYDDIPETGDEFEDNRLGSARIACGILKKMAEMNVEFHFNFALIIAHLARKAMLTNEERTTVFGKDVIERGLFQQVYEGSQSAIAFVMLERIDREEFSAAANLAHDIVDWKELVEVKLDEFHCNMGPDAALLCLLANCLGGVQYLNEDIQAMETVVRERHPNIDKFFELL